VIDRPSNTTGARQPCARRDDCAVVKLSYACASTKILTWAGPRCMRERPMGRPISLKRGPRSRPA